MAIIWYFFLETVKQMPIGRIRGADESSIYVSDNLENNQGFSNEIKIIDWLSLEKQSGCHWKNNRNFNTSKE